MNRSYLSNSILVICRIVYFNSASKAVYVFELIPLILVACGVPVAAILVVVDNNSVSDMVVLPIPVAVEPMDV